MIEINYETFGDNDQLLCVGSNLLCVFKFQIIKYE